MTAATAGAWTAAQLQDSEAGVFFGACNFYSTGTATPDRAMVLVTTVHCRASSQALVNVYALGYSLLERQTEERILHPANRSAPVCPCRALAEKTSAGG